MRFYGKRFHKNRQLLAKRQCQDTQIYHQNKQKKVLVCLHSLDWGGAERFAYETLQFLQNYHIPYLIFVEKQTQVAEHFYDLIQDKNLLVYANKYQDSAQQVLDVVAYESINSIYIHHSYSAYKALTGLSKDIFVIDSLHIIEYQTGGYPYLSAKYSKYIDVHHVVSIGLKQYLSDNLGVAEYKLKLGYLIKEIGNEPTKKIWDNKNITIGFLGRFERQKRPELFVELAKKMQKYHNIKFMMQGDGLLKEKTQQLAKKYALNNVVFNEASNKIESFFQQIDILVNSAENEGLTLVGIESLQHQVIFVSTNVGQQNEITSSHCLVSAKPSDFILQTYNLILNLISNRVLRDEVLIRQADILKGIKNQQFYDVILKKYMVQ